MFSKSGLFRHSLSQQLLTTVGISIISIALITIAIDYYLIEKNLQQQVQRRARMITHTLEFATEGVIMENHRGILRRIVQNYATLPTIKEVAIIDPDGFTLAHSAQLLTHQTYKDQYPMLTQLMETAATKGTDISVEIQVNQKSWLVQILPFSSTLFNKPGHRGLLIAIIDLQEMRQEVREILWKSALAMISGIIIFLCVLIFLLQRIILSPLNVLHQAVAKSRDTGTFFMPKNLPMNEIGSLATTFELVFDQRTQAETSLKESEANEREKTQQLTATLTELTKAQAQLIQQEKMSSLGQLVAGVAHEINNPVSFIFGNLIHAEEYFNQLCELIQLYQKNYPQPPEEIEKFLEEFEISFIIGDLEDLLKSIKNGSHRIRDIVNSLREFSRLDESSLKQVNLQKDLDNTLTILQHRLGEIQVIKSYQDLPLVQCYSREVNQVFLNILNNAVDALKAKENSGLNLINSPKIWIETQKINETTIEIKIRDNGIGVSASVREKMFNPFFTTKPVGQGTGLGLAIAYQIIVEQHHGQLECNSQLNQGTEFIIQLPIVQI